MVSAKAIGEILNSGVLVGYKLLDEKGNIMEVKCESIVSAIKNNLISISNLTLTDSDKLVMLEDKKETAEKVEDNTEVRRIKELVNKLNNARKVYEQGTDEVMSNLEYDKLYDELSELEAKTGIVYNSSPTVNVGYEVVSNLPKEKHDKLMLSLGKTKDRGELKETLQGREGLLSWKMDGLTVVLTYDRGKLVKAVTRGNGEIGELVTNNVKQFKNVPREISFNGKLVLRGEAIIKYSDFEKINAGIALDEDKYKNPRNLCSGSVRQLDSSVTASRNVNWYCFEVVECIGGNCGSEFDKQLNFVKVLGLDVVDYKKIEAGCGNFEEVMKYFGDKVSSFDIPTDGLVITFNDRIYGENLGSTAKTPRHSKAFKWKDESHVTTLEYIDWSPSRTGLINPVAVFKPIDIDGSTVSRASVHNVSILTELELGYGDQIEVYKANMIIPQISNNITRSNTCEIPSTCPCCGGDTSLHREENSGVYTLYCDNSDCTAKGNKLMEHFVTRDAMNIDGISGATLEVLVEEGIITDLTSIFHIHEHGYEIVNMDGFGVTSFNKMVAAIDKARTIKTANLIYALGIPNVGLSTAKLICKNFGNDLIKTVTAKYSQLINIGGIGETIAYSFTSYFSNETNAKQFVELIKELNVVADEISSNTEMSGVTICVTGDVFVFPNRRAIKELVENLGGKMTGSVSKSTSYLVTNDTTSGSNKNKQAQEYGVPILTEQEFIDKFKLQV